MAENINAYCAICGKGYHVCNSCLEQKTFKPWRTIVDSIEHYKIYMAIHGYTLLKNKELAKQELEKCDLSGLENFKPEIKTVIKEIMTEPKKNKTTTKREVVIKTKENIEEADVKEINE
jgi:hypothetical protein